MSDAPSLGDDGWIINGTKQQLNDRRQVQFSIQLPSGRTVTSEWISEDNKRKALPIWLDTIKQQAKLDADEKVAQARRLAASRPKPVPQIVDPAGDALSVEPMLLPTIGGMASAPKTTSAEPSSSIGTALSSSPDAFARQGLDQARKQLEHWNAQAAVAMEKAMEASANVDKWERILAAVNGQGVKEVEKSVRDSVSDNRPVRRRRRVGAKQSAESGSGSQPSANIAAAIAAGEAAGRVIITKSLGDLA